MNSRVQSMLDYARGYQAGKKESIRLDRDRARDYGAIRFDVTSADRFKDYAAEAALNQLADLLDTEIPCTVCKQVSGIGIDKICTSCYQSRYPDEVFPEREMTQREEDERDNPRDTI